MASERDLSGVVLAGRYRVLAQIGGGGMGTVHVGEHLEVGRKVAIKILRPEAVARPALVERFRREARLTARIEHEHVVECLDVGVSDDGECFYVMEWLRGEDLQALLRRERTLTWPRARAIVAQVCRALAAAHERGVVHRDLKPGNIFLIQREDNRDFVKVLDFGIAKLMAADESASEALTRTGEVVGTTPYMAPELAAGEAFDHRIDVYATGVILFQLLAGRLPFRGKSPRQILAEILKGEPPRVASLNPAVVVSPALEAVLMKALHRDVGQRYADMAALHDAMLELPDDAARPAGADEAGVDASASEVAMAASMIGPMIAASRDPGADSGHMTVTSNTRGAAAQEPHTPIEPRQRGARQRSAPRRLGLVFAGMVLGLAGVGGWMLWPWGAAAPGIPGVVPGVIAAVVETSVVETSVVETSVVETAVVETAVVETSVPVEHKRPPVDEQRPTVTEQPVPPPAGPDAQEREPEALGLVGDSKQRARGEARSGFDDVMRRATAKVRRCLVQGGVKAGTRVRFDVVVEANTGRITAATPRARVDGQARLGACVVAATRGTSVRPPPSNEWRRSHEFEA